MDSSEYNQASDKINAAQHFEIPYSLENTYKEDDFHDINLSKGNETPSSSYNENEILTDFKETIGDYIDKELWDDIGKELSDYTLLDLERIPFNSLEHCHKFYMLYSKAKGFGVRKDQTTKSRSTKEPIATKLVCRKEGFCEPRKENIVPQIIRAIERSGCEAFIHFKLLESKKWRVVKFNGEHNHPMIEPRLISYDRSHRNVSAEQGDKIDSMVKARIPKRSIMRHFVKEVGSHEGVGFSTKDLNNRCAKKRKQIIADAGGDVEAALAFLIGKRTSDPSLFISHTTDKFDRLENLFWCDGASQVDYKAFGHVLAFDTTYKVNCYNKPFIVLVGVNHHRQTVCFGCALLISEKEDIFVWVLKQLMKAVGGKEPLAVITDGDSAMANAIEVVFPKARHRLCLWHLMRNVKTNSKNDNKKRFPHGFMRCVDQCLTIEDFEKAWDELVKYHGVKDKPWANNMYRNKEKWAESYLRGQFFAGMRSTQRCEAMNRTLKRVLNEKLKLFEFVELYCDQLAAIRYEERQQDYQTQHTFPKIEGVLRGVKNHAAKVYTRRSYVALCSEMLFESHCVVKVVEERDNSEDPVYYWLSDAERPHLWYLVIHDTVGDDMFCCMKLESVGLPCRHMFAVMKYANLDKIPTCCILKRWTIDAKEDIGHSGEVNDQVAKGKKNTHKMPSHGIRDPVVIPTGRGRKKRSAKTHVTLEESLEPSLKRTKKTGNEPEVSLSEIAKAYMPNIYRGGGVSEDTFSYDLEEMENDPSKYSWSPKEFW